MLFRCYSQLMRYYLDYHFTDIMKECVCYGEDFANTLDSVMRRDELYYVFLDKLNSADCNTVLKQSAIDICKLAKEVSENDNYTPVLRASLLEGLANGYLILAREIIERKDLQMNEFKFYPKIEI